MIPKEPKRYQDWDNEDGLPFSDGVATRESEDGCYVLFSDHSRIVAEMEAENKRLREAAKQLSDMQLTGRFVWCPAGMCDQCDKDREAIAAIRKELESK